ncbi:TetR family transcriptional regulator [Nonomuraea sp. NPDC050556]|uniref:TetR family transcriptional regulator n=1 Tax=Nonomuraea sp. NPDC050556 TaxID=3364369 RepID=UPI0037AC2DE2
MQDGLRQRKQAHTRKSLTEAAVRLFEEQGFDDTTVEQIAEAVMVSRRTFHRYFGSKDEVILAHEDEQFELVLTALRARPPHESALQALQKALTAPGGFGLRRNQRIQRLINGNPALLAANTHRFLLREQALAGCFAVRAGVDPERDPRPRMLAALALTALRVALQEWISGGELTMSGYVTRVGQALGLLGRGLDLPGTTPHR